MMIKDIDINVEEFFKTYAKEEIISSLKDLYDIHDCLSLKVEIIEKYFKVNI